MMSIEADGTIIGKDGRILLMSCRRFIDDIISGDDCFICGADPSTKNFNGEHIIPDWVLRRFGLFDKEIILPNGDKKKYARYKVPCCVECNSLLGRDVETRVSKLLEGDFATISSRLTDEAINLLFVWTTLVFLKTHLKDQVVRIEKDQRKGDAVIGDGYDWSTMHHIHAIARSPYTDARLGANVVGSIRLYEIEDDLTTETFDYVDFTLDHTLVVRVGSVGIVTTLTDAGAADHAWSERLSVIHGPISEIQLREIGAMFACANRNLIYRPKFATTVHDGQDVEIINVMPPQYQLNHYDPMAFGHALLFAIGPFVEKGAIMVDGTRDPNKVADSIASGRVHFLFDEAGGFRKAQTLRKGKQ
jgi:hypothetical protein